MDLLTVSELAKVLKIKNVTVYRLIKDGLPCIKIGKGYRFTLQEVQTFINTKKQKDKSVTTI